LVLVNTGPGKGKTTAALGTLVRALGHGHKTALIQFIKSAPTGESRFLESFEKRDPESVTYARIGLGFIRDNPTEDDFKMAKEGMDLARDFSKVKNLLVLDEVNIALDKGLIPVAEMREFLENRPEGLTVILTGRGCPAEIVEIADTVTEMTEIKHAYHAGIPAKKGVDF
jgi:cob(I)alamin adenosyltransferase